MALLDLERRVNGHARRVTWVFFAVVLDEVTGSAVNVLKKQNFKSSP